MTLTTTDSTGSVSIGSVPIFVFSGTPEAEIAAPNGSPGEGMPLSMSATMSGPSLLRPLTYQWTVLKNGDAFASATSADSVYTFTPDDEGPYQIELTVSATEYAKLVVSVKLKVGVGELCDAAITVAGGVTRVSRYVAVH